MKDISPCPLCGHTAKLGTEIIRHNEICSTESITISCVKCFLTLKKIKKPFYDFTFYYVKDFRETEGLRESETLKYDEFIKIEMADLIELWNNRV